MKVSVSPIGSAAVNAIEASSGDQHGLAAPFGWHVRWVASPPSMRIVQIWSLGLSGVEPDDFSDSRDASAGNALGRFDTKASD